MTRTVGYIVHGSMGPMLLSRQSGVLAFGRTATLFASRRAAQAVIERTNAYSKARGHDWHNWAKYQVCRVAGATP